MNSGNSGTDGKVPALKLFLQSFAIFSKIGSPNANKAKKGISLCRQKMPEERFQAILKEFEIDTKVFDPEDDETYRKITKLSSKT